LEDFAWKEEKNESRSDGVARRLFKNGTEIVAHEQSIGPWPMAVCRRRIIHLAIKSRIGMMICSTRTTEP